MNKEPKKTLKRLLIALAAVIAGLALAFLIVSGYFYGHINYSELSEDGGNMQIPQEELDSILESLDTEELTDEWETEAPDTTAPDVTVPDTDSPDTTAPALPPSDGDVRHILLIGADYVGDNGLSDIMVVVSVNDSNHTITCTSLMRDTRVYIPVNDGVYTKLNSAHQIGGASLLVKTVELNFGIEIDRYIRVGFDESVRVFDSLGGLTVRLDEAEIGFIKKHVPESTLTFDPDEANEDGYVMRHLNGLELRAHARNRSTGGRVDFNRTRRQREILEAAFEKAKTMNIAQLTSLLTTALPLVTTDISYAEFLGYILASPIYLTYDFQPFRIPPDGCWKYSDAYIVITDLDRAMKEWYDKVYK